MTDKIRSKAERGYLLKTISQDDNGIAWIVQGENKRPSGSEDAVQFSKAFPKILRFAKVVESRSRNDKIEMLIWKTQRSHILLSEDCLNVLSGS